MKRILLAGGGLAVAAIVAVVVYVTVIREDAPEAFTLSDPSDQADTDSGSDSESDGGSDSGSDADADAGSDDAVGSDGLDGTWTVADGSEAGYRVVEDLGSVLDFEAVGRTSDVTGSIVISGTEITDGTFEVDIASITSDDDRRDGQFRGRIMNAAEFPTATLTLDSVDIGSIPDANSSISTSATGELTLRGVTNPVTLDVSAQLLGAQIEIVASIDVLFSDYDIDNPSNPVATVRDEGKVEARLLLEMG